MIFQCFRIGWNRGTSTVWLKSADFMLNDNGELELSSSRAVWTKNKDKADGIPNEGREYMKVVVRCLRKEGRDVFIEDV